MTRETLALTEEQIQERLAILWATDAQECGACGTKAGAVADDPDWFIDVMIDASGTALAVIRCPWCW